MMMMIYYSLLGYSKLNKHEGCADVVGEMTTKDMGRVVYTTWEWDDGSRYAGEWKEGKQHGRGSKVWVNGDMYDGEWKEGVPHGRGILTWANGDKYDGEWMDGKRSGRGVLVWVNGKRYDGEWRDGKIYGRGVLTWTDGERYDGEWRDAMPNGRGVFTWADGWSYCGDFKVQDDALVMDASGVFCHTQSAQCIAATLVGIPAQLYRKASVQKDVLDEFLKREDSERSQST